MRSFIQCGMVNEALDACIQLNQWEQAVQLSKTYNLRDVHLLLNRYAEQLTGIESYFFYTYYHYMIYQK